MEDKFRVQKKMYESKLSALKRKISSVENEEHPRPPNRERRNNTHHLTSSASEHSSTPDIVNRSAINVNDSAMRSKEDMGLFDDYDDASAVINPLTRAAMDSLNLETVDENALTLRHVEDMFEREIFCFGKITTMKQVCNFTPGNVFEASCHRGVVFASAHEQGFKSSLITAVKGVTSITRRPTMLVAGLNHDPTKEMTGKMEQILESFNIKTRFLSNANGGWERFKNNKDEVDKFKAGKLLIVTPGYAMERTSILEEIDARNAMVILDESDNIFRKDPSMWAPDSKEANFVNLIKDPQRPDSRVTTVILISATHLSDFHIWKRFDVPKLYISASMDHLRDRGFTTHADMQHFQDVGLDEINASTKYGINTPAFEMLMHDFKTCPGRRKLMLIASSPYVNAEEKCTLFTQAYAVLEMDPEALIIVHYSGKCFFVYSDGKGRKQNVEMTERKMNTPGASQRKAKKVKTIEKALRHLEKRYCVNASGQPRHTNEAGPSNRPVRPVAENEVDRRFIVIGYNALTRSTSPRTSTIVPTHTFTAMSRSRNAADVRQTTMRPAGKTTEVRRANGHGKVKVVTPKEDWDMVCALYGFQEAIAEESLRNPDFDFETYEEYSIAAEPVVKSTRSMAPPQMRMRPSWNYKATDVEEEEARARKEAERREMEERRRVFMANDRKEDASAATYSGKNDNEYIEEVDVIDTNNEINNEEIKSKNAHQQITVMRAMYEESDDLSKDIILRELHAKRNNIAIIVKSQHNIYERLRKKGYIMQKGFGTYSITEKGRSFVLSV